MTAIDVSYNYQGELEAPQVGALRQAFSVYGVRAINVDETQHRITIEYDATRLNESQVAAILRSGGINVTASPDRPE